MPSIPELEELRRKQILEAGFTMLMAKGSANVTMDDVCAEAGLSKGGLVHYYKSKRLLFSAIFETFFQRIFQRSADTMALHQDPMDQILSFDWLYHRDDPDSYAGYPLLLDFMSLAVHDPEYRALLQDWIGNWVALLTKSLEQGIAQGVFFPMDVQDVAQSISAVYQGVATRWYLAGDSHSTEWAIRTYRKSITGILSPHMP